MQAIPLVACCDYNSACAQDKLSTRDVAISGLAEDRIRKAGLWKSTVEVSPLHGGLSNESFLVEDGVEKYVVRFGHDYPFHHVDRAREIMVARAAHAAGFAPEIIYSEPGMMVSRFIDGVTYGETEVQKNHEIVARLLRRFHEEMGAHVSGSGFIFWVFHVIRDYARTLEAGNSRMKPELPGYLKLASKLESVQMAMPIVFAHHDLLPANFIDDGSRLWLIDFEYAGFGTAMFDLAGITSNAGFDADLTTDFLTRYFDHEPDELFRQSHAAMACASLLREAMWSMVSELYLDAPGVDYAAYTTENLVRFDRALEIYQVNYGKA